MILQDLVNRNIAHPPKWLCDNTFYLTEMGSRAYGVSTDNSDIDIYGFCIPPKEIIFPHLNGIIKDFGDQGEVFGQYQEHHLKHPDKDTEYDFTVFSIVKYFSLCMENNPNSLDSLFTPRRCVIHSTKISEHVRSNRKLFLHTGSYSKFRGYAYSQLSKIKNKTNSSNPKRAADIEKNGFDTKFAYHIIRLALEAEQIMATHDLDLERDREIMKSVRRGEWSLNRINQWFQDKEKTLEELYTTSTLRKYPDEKLIKALLLESLEMHYGTLTSAIIRNPQIDSLLSDINTLVEKYR